LVRHLEESLSTRTDTLFFVKKSINCYSNELMLQ